MQSFVSQALAVPGFPILVTIGLFAVIIAFHEFGHFLVAKLARMRVYELSLGFGRPVLMSFERHGTRYSVRPVPIGGFVRIAGMEPDEDVPDGFDKKPIPSRLAVIAAGSVMNLALAVLLFWAIGLVYGKVVDYSSRIDHVIAGTPAAAAGLQAGDVLAHAEPMAVTEVAPPVAPASAPSKTMELEELRDVIRGRPDMPIRLVLQRGEEYLALRIVPQLEKEQDIEQESEGGSRLVMREVGQIGVVFATVTEPVGFLESVGNGFAEAYHMTKTLILVLVHMILGKLPMAVGGPVQIVDVMSDAARVGWRTFLFWSALISLNVGVINLLPVPALDGSRLVFLTIEGIRRRPIDRRKEAIVHLIGFALLLLLLVLITLNDVMRLIEKYIG